MNTCIRRSLKRRAQIVKRQRLCLITVSFLMILLSVFVIRSKTGIVNAENTRQKYFTHITVEAGDTMWDIAAQYMTEEYDSVNAYIHEVEHMNHISGDDIMEGSSIMIPYYAEHPLQ